MRSSCLASLARKPRHFRSLLATFVLLLVVARALGTLPRLGKVRLLWKYVATWRRIPDVAKPGASLRLWVFAVRWLLALPGV